MAFKINFEMGLVAPKTGDIKAIKDQIEKGLGKSVISIKPQLDKASVDAFKKELQTQLSAQVVPVSIKLVGPTTGASSVSTAVSQLSNPTVSKNLQNLERGLRQVDAEMRKIERVRAGQTINNLSESMEQFADRTGIALKRFLAFTLATGGIVKVASEFKQAFSAAVQFEESLVKIGQVSDRSLKNLDGLRNSILNISRSIGTDSNEIANAALTIAQAGIPLKEVKGALEAIAKAQVSPTFGTAQESAEALIAVMSQFKKEAGNYESVLARINFISAREAVEAKDLITSVQKAGGAFALAGSNLNEFLSIITAVRATTRESADSIATGLRTITSRIADKDTIEFFRRKYQVDIAPGDKVDDTITAIGKIRNRMKELGQLPIKTTIDPLTGNVIEELDKKTVAFSEVLEKLGGQRQQSRLIPLFTEYNKIIQLVSSFDEIDPVSRLKKSETTLAKDVEASQAALQRSVDRTKESFKQLGNELLQNDGTRRLIELFLAASRAIADTTKEVVKFSSVFIPLFAGPVVKGISTIFNPARLIGAKPSFNLDKYATGGEIFGNTPGDSVPCMLTPGEVVLNKGQQANISRITGMSARDVFGKIGVPGFSVGGRADKNDRQFNLYSKFISSYFPQMEHFGGDISRDGLSFSAFKKVLNVKKNKPKGLDDILDRFIVNYDDIIRKKINRDTDPYIPNMSRVRDLNLSYDNYNLKRSKDLYSTIGKMSILANKLGLKTPMAGITLNNGVMASASDLIIRFHPENIQKDREHIESTIKHELAHYADFTNVKSKNGQSQYDSNKDLLGSTQTGGKYSGVVKRLLPFVNLIASKVPSNLKFLNNALAREYILDPKEILAFSSQNLSSDDYINFIKDPDTFKISKLRKSYRKSVSRYFAGKVPGFNGGGEIRGPIKFQQRHDPKTGFTYLNDDIGGSAFFNFDEDGIPKIIGMDSVPRNKKYTNEENNYKRRGFLTSILQHFHGSGHSDFIINMQSHDTMAALDRLRTTGKITADESSAGGPSFNRYYRKHKINIDRFAKGGKVTADDVYLELDRLSKTYGVPWQEIVGGVKEIDAGKRRASKERFGYVPVASFKGKTKEISFNPNNPNALSSIEHEFLHALDYHLGGTGFLSEQEGSAYNTIAKANLAKTIKAAKSSGLTGKGLERSTRLRESFVEKLLSMKPEDRVNTTRGLVATKLPSFSQGRTSGRDVSDEVLSILSGEEEKARLFRKNLPKTGDKIRDTLIDLGKTYGIDPFSIISNIVPFDKKLIAEQKKASFDTGKRILYYTPGASKKSIEEEFIHAIDASRGMASSIKGSTFYNLASSNLPDFVERLQSSGSKRSFTANKNKGVALARSFADVVSKMSPEQKILLGSGMSPIESYSGLYGEEAAGVARKLAKKGKLYAYSANEEYYKISPEGILGNRTISPDRLPKGAKIIASQPYSEDVEAGLKKGANILDLKDPGVTKLDELAASTIAKSKRLDPIMRKLQGIGRLNPQALLSEIGKFSDNAIVKTAFGDNNVQSLGVFGLKGLTTDDTSEIIRQYLSGESSGFFAQKKVEGPYFGELRVHVAVGPDGKARIIKGGTISKGSTLDPTHKESTKFLVDRGYDEDDARSFMGRYKRAAQKSALRTIQEIVDKKKVSNAFFGVDVAGTSIKSAKAAGIETEIFKGINKNQYGTVVFETNPSEFTGSSGYVSGSVLENFVGGIFGQQNLEEAVFPKRRRGKEIDPTTLKDKDGNLILGKVPVSKLKPQDYSQDLYSSDLIERLIGATKSASKWQFDKPVGLLERLMSFSGKGLFSKGKSGLQNLLKANIFNEDGLTDFQVELGKTLKYTDIYGNFKLKRNMGGEIPFSLIKKFAHGGTVPGTGFGDTVPALLSPGEVVLNKRQQGKLDQLTGSSAALFKAAGVPGFKDGGSPGITSPKPGRSFGDIAGTAATAGIIATSLFPVENFGQLGKVIQELLPTVGLLGAGFAGLNSLFGNTRGLKNWRDEFEDSQIKLIEATKKQEQYGESLQNSLNVIRQGKNERKFLGELITDQKKKVQDVKNTGSADDLAREESVLLGLQQKRDAVTLRSKSALNDYRKVSQSDELKTNKQLLKDENDKNTAIKQRIKDGEKLAKIFAAVGAAGLAASSFISGYGRSQINNAQLFDNDQESSGKSKIVAGGAISAGVTGASLAAQTGNPYLIAAAAVGGTVLGAYSGIKEADNLIKEKYSEALKNLTESLRSGAVADTNQIAEFGRIVNKKYQIDNSGFAQRGDFSVIPQTLGTDAARSSLAEYLYKPSAIFSPFQTLDRIDADIFGFKTDSTGKFNAKTYEEDLYKFEEANSPISMRNLFNLFGYGNNEVENPFDALAEKDEFGRTATPGSRGGKYFKNAEIERDTSEFLLQEAGKFTNFEEFNQRYSQQINQLATASNIEAKLVETRFKRIITDVTTVKNQQRAAIKALDDQADGIDKFNSSLAASMEKIARSNIDSILGEDYRITAPSLRKPDYNDPKQITQFQDDLDFVTGGFGKFGADAGGRFASILREQSRFEEQLRDFKAGNGQTTEDFTEKFFASSNLSTTDKAILKGNVSQFFGDKEFNKDSIRPAADAAKNFAQLLEQAKEPIELMSKATVDAANRLSGYAKKVEQLRMQAEDLRRPFDQISKAIDIRTSSKRITEREALGIRGENERAREVNITGNRNSQELVAEIQRLDKSIMENEKRAPTITNKGLLKDLLVQIEAEKAARERAKNGLDFLAKSTERLTVKQNELQQAEEERLGKRQIFETLGFGTSEDKFSLQRDLEVLKDDRFAGEAQVRNTVQRFRGVNVPARDVGIDSDRTLDELANELAAKTINRAGVGQTLGVGGNLGAETLQTNRQRKLEAEAQEMINIQSRAQSGQADLLETQTKDLLNAGVKEFTSVLNKNKFASGGIVPGVGFGDSVPAMLTPGEIVLNKRQQRELGISPSMFSMASDGVHFANGGVVRPNFYQRHKALEAEVNEAIYKSLRNTENIRGVQSKYSARSPSEKGDEKYYSKGNTIYGPRTAPFRGYAPGVRRTSSFIAGRKAEDHELYAGTLYNDGSRADLIKRDFPDGRSSSFEKEPAVLSMKQIMDKKEFSKNLQTSLYKRSLSDGKQVNREFKNNGAPFRGYTEQEREYIKMKMFPGAGKPFRGYVNESSADAYSVNKVSQNIVNANIVNKPLEVLPQPNQPSAQKIIQQVKQTEDQEKSDNIDREKQRIIKKYYHTIDRQDLLSLGRELKSVVTSPSGMERLLDSGSSLALLTPDSFSEFVLGLNSGGIVRGVGSVDSVPAMLTPGEMVLNKNQQRAIGNELGASKVLSEFEKFFKEFRADNVTVKAQKVVLEGESGIQKIEGSISLEGNMNMNININAPGFEEMGEALKKDVMSKINTQVVEILRKNGVPVDRPIS